MINDAFHNALSKVFHSDLQNITVSEITVHPNFRTDYYGRSVCITMKCLLTQEEYQTFYNLTQDPTTTSTTLPPDLITQLQDQIMELKDTIDDLKTTISLRDL